jgi:Mn2+/Fe2+ NRAMP family transporter
MGAQASLDLDSRHFQLFYAAFIGLTVAAVSVVSIPGLPLIPLIYSSQVINAVLLPLHAIALHLLAKDVSIDGRCALDAPGHARRATRHRDHLRLRDGLGDELAEKPVGANSFAHSKGARNVRANVRLKPDPHRQAALFEGQASA